MFGPDQKAKFIKQLETYQDRLLDISWRNRSVLLRKTMKKWNIDLATLAPETPEEVLLDNVRRRESTCLLRDTARGDDADEYRDHLTQLSRQANLVADESGLKETYVGFPFLAGRITSEHYVRAPLLLFPVHVTHTKERRPQGWHAGVLADEDVTINRALVAALRKIAGIRVAREFEEAAIALVDRLRDDDDLTAAALYDEIQTLLRDNELELPTAQWDGFQPLPTLTKEQEQAIQEDPLHLEPYCVLGSFPQGSEAIYEDYENLIERARDGETDQGIIDNLLGAPADPTVHKGDGNGAGADIDRVPASELNNVVDSDASQDQVVLQARDAECEVVRGPPGTGKSQTIVNLIANSLWRGERVLVVCQKRAALDVVYQRLQSTGLANAALLVHDANSDRGATYKQMAHVMTDARPQSAGEDAHDTVNTRIDQTIRTLNAMVKPLWEPFHGTRLAHLYAQAPPGAQPRLELPEAVTGADWPTLQEALGKLETLEANSRRFDTPVHPWHDRVGFQSLGTFGRAQLEDLVRKAQDAAKANYDPLPLPYSAQQMAQELDRFHRRRNRFLRSWSPSWRRSRRATEAYVRSRHQTTVPADLAPWIRAVQARHAVEATLTEIGKHLRPEGAGSLVATMQDRLALQTRLQNLLDSLNDYEPMREHDHRRTDLNSLSRALYDTARTQLATAPAWGPALRQEIFLHWIREAERRWPNVSSDTHHRHKELRDELDRLLELKRRVLVRELDLRTVNHARTPELPPGEHHGNRKPETDWNRTHYELQKQRRVWPIRKLIDTYRHIVDRVAPCWLVSPEVASEIFPLERGLFDVVIFDEASQLAVERALPAIYRGKRIIIAGDENQLRPFDLFRTKADDEDDEDDPDPALEAESLLMLAKRTYGFAYLTYHYRSRHAELINYSNHAFYGGTLEVIASLHRSEDGKPPREPAIQWHRVNGLWNNRRNNTEALKVVELIEKTLAGPTIEGRMPTVGVITFNDQQRNHILDEIDKRVNKGGTFAGLWNEADNPLDGDLDKKPFVKNIENVQGDERDIIIFSVAYGKDPNGVFRQQFGTLSQEGGENRLNVAVTRAKYGVHVVCSIDPRDLRADTTRNAGPKRLRDYLLYAEAVSASNRTTIEEVLTALNEGFKRKGPAVKRFDSPLEEAVHDALEQRGLTVDTQVGYSGYAIDLAIVHPNDPERYILAVECDGATYHSAKSCRERDVGRQRFLERMGWKVERVWSRNWWTTRDREVERIASRVNQLVRSGAQTIAANQDRDPEEANPRPRRTRRATP